jgi:transcriptional regulator with XRE-family HTH domain
MDIERSLRLSIAYRNITQKELAANVGITEGYLSRIKHGHEVPNLEMLKRLSTALGYKTSEFIALGEA